MTRRSKRFGIVLGVILLGIAGARVAHAASAPASSSVPPRQLLSPL